MTVALIFFSPLQYFRTAGRPNWTAAIAAVALHAGFTAIATAVMDGRLLAAQGDTGLAAQVTVVLAAAGTAVHMLVLFAVDPAAVRDAVGMVKWDGGRIPGAGVRNTRSGWTVPRDQLPSQSRMRSTISPAGAPPASSRRCANR